MFFNQATKTFYLALYSPYQSEVRKGRAVRTYIGFCERENCDVSTSGMRLSRCVFVPVWVAPTAPEAGMLRSSRRAAGDGPNQLQAEQRICATRGSNTAA